MATRMTGLCEKGAALLWKQCNGELYRKGVSWLEDAAYSGDADAWYFLGLCHSRGYGALEVNRKKAVDCYIKAASAGSFRAVFGAVQEGFSEEPFRLPAAYTPEESVRELRTAAEKGDAYAAYQLAEAYECGLIFNWSKAAEEELPPQPAAFCIPWYKKAADGGIVEAMVKLGKCYRSGQYVEQNMERYIDWADKAAAAGHVWGLSQMGQYYYDCGEMEAAFAYFQAAAKQGDSKAPLELGRMYLRGEGTLRSVPDAAAAFELAASRGETESLLELGHLHDADGEAEWEKKTAMDWYRKAYEAGEKEAAFPLACLYLRTSKVEDCRTAEELLKAAVQEEQDGRAALLLGNICRDGLNGQMDLEAAIVWYEKGAGQNNPECMEVLGCLFFQGEEGIDADYAKSFYWLNRCLEAGTLQSYSKLACLYTKGIGCEVNEEKAIELFERAAQTECDGYAFYELGFLYEKKGGTQENLEKAAEYYQRAIGMGNEDAVRRFSHFKKNIFGRWKLID